MTIERLERPVSMFVYLAVTGARVEIPAAVSIRTQGDETQFLDAAGAVVAVFQSIDVLVYSMTPIETEPPSPGEYSGK
jgi:hypothetical protein